MISAPRLFRVSAFLALAAGLASGLRADDSPTPSPTSTASPTATLTSTPGSGYYGVSVLNDEGQPVPTPFLVPGNTGNEMQISYTATSQFTGGLLTFVFPADLGQPNAGNFSVIPIAAQQAALQSPPTFSNFPNGVSVSVAINSLPNGSLSALIFNYGGFTFPAAASTTLTTCIQVYAYPQSVTLGAGGLVPPSAPPPVIWTATVSPTDTPTFTPTLSNTPSPIYSVTVSPTNTASPTNTPVGPVRPAVGFYTYPNPFDQRIYPFVTVRFPPTDESVTIAIFSLAGNPVRTRPFSVLQPSVGIAQWDGTDDYGRPVPGGLYFVRLKTPTGTTVHKMTVFR